MNGWELLYLILAGLFAVASFFGAFLSWRRRPRQEKAFRVILCLPLAGLIAALVDALLLGDDWDARIRIGLVTAELALWCWTPVAFFIMWLGLASLARRSRVRSETDGRFRSAPSSNRAAQG